MNQQISQVNLDEFLGVEPPSFWQRHRKLILIAAAVIAVMLLAWFLLAGRGQTKSYATSEVSQGNLQVSVTATGNLAPTNKVQVGSELSGLIETVYVDVNDRVTKGQVLAQLDTLRLRDALTRSRAALAQAQAGVAQAQATLRQASANYGRLQNVYRISGGKVPSRAELDIGLADRDRAIANLRSAQAQVASAQGQLSSDNTNLQKATIRSPVTGVVLSRQVEPGQTVAASFNTPTLFDIAEDLSSMELEVKVDEADVGSVAAGQPASFTVDAFPGRKFPAQILRVNLGANSPSASASSGGSSVISYNAVLKVDNPELTLRPGMTATANILTSEARGVLLVPNAALRFKPKDLDAAPGGLLGGPQQKAKQAQISSGTKQTLYVQGADGALRAASVVAGATNGSLTIVTGTEIHAGDKVVTGELAADK